jgi:YVTN family beta-propeller protein
MVKFFVTLTVLLTLVFGKPVQVVSEDSPSSPKIQTLTAESRLENLTIEADLILVGTVTDTLSHWNEGVTSIFTDVKVSIENVVAGDESLQHVTVVVEGGRVGDLRLSVSGSPEFQVNERAILFLKQNSSGSYSPAGWQDGIFAVSGDKVDPDTSLSSFIWQIQQIMKSHGIPIPVGQPDLQGNTNVLSTPASLSPANATTAPTIAGITPASGSAGTNTQIVISGSNFGPTQGSSKVTFYYKSGQPRIEAPIVFWTDTSIVASVPVGTINGYAASASSGEVMISTSAGDSDLFQFGVTFGYLEHKWSGVHPVVHFRVNPNVLGVDNEESAVQAAAQTWNSVSGVDFDFNYDGLTEILNPAYDGLNTVLWSDLGSEGPIATTSYWYDQSYNLLEFDLEFNNNYPWSTSLSGEAYDIQTIATHELGHALGLSDLYGDESTPNDKGKVMYGRGAIGENKRDLTSDEISGIRWIYPVMSVIKLGDGGFGATAIGINSVTNRIYAANSKSNNVSVIDGETDSVITTIDAGNNSQGITVNPITNRIYLANTFSNSVSVIDGASNSVISIINVGHVPFRLGVNPTTNCIYVANSYSDTVSVINGDTNTVIATVNVGGGPSGVAVNPTTNLVYVSNDESNSVSVINGDNNTVVASIGVGTGPGGIEVNSSNNRVYVANYSSNTISVIDGGANSVMATLSVGTSPRGVAVNLTNNRVYVANYGSNNVSVVNGDNNTVSSTVGVGTKPFGIGVNAATNRVYVANYQSNSISIINGVTNGVILTQKIGSSPDAMGFNSATNRVYVANSGSNDVAVIDSSTDSILTTISVGNVPSGIGVNSITNRIYVTNSGSNNVSVINGDNNTVTATVNVGNRPGGVGVNPSTNRIYVANNGGHSMSVIDGVSNSLIATIGIGFLPIGVDVNPITNRIYVANNYNNTVSVIDGSSNSVVTTVDVGTWPYGLSVNPLTDRIYVANNGSNTVSVIDGVTNSVVATSMVGVEPEGVGVNPTTNRIYVANNGNNSVSVIDGISNIVVATQNVGKGPRNVGLYTGTNRICVTNYFSDNLAILEDVVSTPGTAAKLSFTTHPGDNNTAGVSFASQPIVTVQDAGGNTVTTSTDPVTVAITSGTGTTGAVLSGTKTVNAVNGLASFSGLSIDKIGTGYTLTATCPGLTPAMTTAFNLNSPALSLSSRTPTPNLLNVAVDSNIAVTFNTNIDNTTVSASTFTVNGSLSGRIAGAYGTDNSSVTFNPNNNFKVGETITVTLTTGIQNTLGSAFTAAATWQFMIEVIDGPASFLSSVNFGPVNDPTYSIALGDIDRDGDLDIVVGTGGSQNRVYKNNGGGSNWTAVNLGTGSDFTRSIALGDVDGDGDLDIVMGCNNQNVVYINDGTGNVWSAVKFGTGTDSTSSVVLGDVDGDGDLDIVVGNNGEQSMVYKNDGTGTTWTGVNFGPTNDPTYSVALGDVDGDGDLDIVAGINSEQSVVYKNDGTGTTWTGIAFGSGVDSTGTIALGDVDGDGDLDIVMGNYHRQNVVYKNNGNGTSWTGANFGLINDDTYSIALGDMDGDGNLDMVVGNNGSGEQNLVYKNDGTGTTWTGVNFGPGFDRTYSIALGDVDGDGDLDIAVGNQSQQNVVYMNSAPEIKIEGNFIEIVNRDVTPSVSDFTDFGITAVANNTVEKTYTIRNVGDAALTLSATPKINLSGTHAADFNVVNLPASSITASGSTTFSIRFDPSAAGLHSAIVSISNNDNDENPYTFAIQGRGTLPLTVTGLTAQSKEYDSNTTAIFTGTATLSGLISGDNVTLGGAPTGTFTDTHVADNVTVTITGFSISGTDSDNYTLTQHVNLNANITSKALTVIGITAANKVYDGNTTATLNTASSVLAGVIAGDNVTLNTASAKGVFVDANAGISKTVTISCLTISGTDAGNYSLIQPVATANITTVTSGGGGGGSTPPQVYLSGFQTNTPLMVNSSGVLQAAAKLQTSDGKLTLDISQGTKLLSSSNLALTILNVTPLTSPPQAPEGNAIVLAYAFSPDGANFELALTLTLAYDPAKLPLNVSEADLYIAYFDGTQWQKLATTIDPLTKTVSAKLLHFSTYGLLGKVSTPAVVTPTPTATPTSTPTTTPTPSPTLTLTPTPSPTPIQTLTATPTPTQSLIPSPAVIALVPEAISTPAQAASTSPLTTPATKSTTPWMVILLVVVGLAVILAIGMIVLRGRKTKPK